MNSKGFTVLEMMIAILVVAVLLMLGAPAFYTIVNNNKLVTEVYTMRTTFAYARSEALARRDYVVVCPSDDGVVCTDSDDWSKGYMTFVDTNDNNVPDITDPTEEIIQWQAKSGDVDITFDNSLNRVRYGTQGYALGFQGTFIFCDERGQEEARALIINPMGSMRGSFDPEEDSIVNGLDNTNVECS